MPGGASSSAVSSSRSPQDQGPAPIAGRINQVDAHRDAGPPEEWLALVRERAPGLLLAVEEGGTPWQEYSSAAMKESKAVEERSSPPIVPVLLEESRPSQSEKLKESALRGGWKLVTPRKPTWLQSLKSKFSARGSVRIPEAEGSRLLRERVASPLVAKHQSLKADEHSAPSQTAPRSERVKQEIQDVLHTPSARASLSKTDVAEKEKTRPQAREKGPLSPSLGSGLRSPRKTGYQSSNSAQQAWRGNARGSGSPTDGTEATCSTSGVDLGSSEQPSVAFGRSKLAFGESKRTRGQSQKDVFGSRTNPKKWLPFPSAAGNPAPGQEGAPAETDQRRFEKRVLPTVPSTPDSGTRRSRRSPELEGDDPWPELPEDRWVPNAKWLEFLRSSERLRALDREQRGGR